MLPELEAVTDKEMTRCTESSARGSLPAWNSFLHFGLPEAGVGPTPGWQGRPLTGSSGFLQALSFIFRSNILFPSTLLFKHKKLVNATYPQIIFITLILYSLGKVFFFFLLKSLAIFT